MSHTSVPGELLEDQCDCIKKREIPFLDTLSSIKDGKIETDLYIKPTDRNQYLLPTSCHPKQTTKSIPKSLGLRIVRVCSDPVKRDQKLSELKKQTTKKRVLKSFIRYIFRQSEEDPQRSCPKRSNKAKSNRKACFCKYI